MVLVLLICEIILFIGIFENIGSWKIPILFSENARFCPVDKQ